MNRPSACTYLLILLIVLYYMYCEGVYPIVLRRK